MDPQGYPDETELQTIAEWPYLDLPGLMEYIKERWKYPEMFRETKTEYQVSTGGWSGNESLIGAMRENLMAWSIMWLKSERGGHYTFETKHCFSETPDI